MAPALLARLLPEGAVGAELFTQAEDGGADRRPESLPDDLPDDGSPRAGTGAAVWAVEAAAVADAVEPRRREFASGRRCARKALAALGLPPVAVPVGERGMPVWPDGVVGSITHCAGYRAAVVAPATLLRGIGVDAEPHAALPGDVLDVVALADELAALPALSAVPTPDGPLHPDLLLFSAKEAVYKAWFPLGRRVLAHPHVRVEPHGDGSFEAGLTSSAPVVPGAPTRFTGRWLVDHGLLLTLAVPAG